MDIVTLGAALNGAKKQTENYVGSHFKGGSNIQITNNPDGTQTINASGEVSAEDTVARETISDHISDKANPHEVTAAQVGLGNVDNTADIDKPVSTAVSAALSDKVDKVTGKGLSTNDFTNAEKTKLDNHVISTNNPHQVTKEQIGLGNVDNVATKDAITELIDSSAKNLIQNAATSRTENGVTFTVNADGTVSLTGTASATIWFPIMTNMSIDAGTYTISNGLTDDTARVIISTTNSLSSRIFDSNESGYITKTVDAISGVNAYLRVASGKVTDGTVVKPMLCTKAAGGISQAYVPYRPSYDELIARVEALEQAAGINSVRSMANLTTETVTDVTETEGGEVR